MHLFINIFHYYYCTATLTALLLHLKTETILKLHLDGILLCDPHISLCFYLLKDMHYQQYISLGANQNLLSELRTALVKTV